MSELTVSELADRLGVTHRRARDVVSSGAIASRRLANGMWLADADSVTRYEIAAVRGRGRRLTAATAWGVLWELSGLDVDWLSPRTHARLRERIRGTTAHALALAVAGRTAQHRFRAANSARAADDLIATGRAASSVLGGELLDDRRRASGYVRRGSVEEYAATHFMIPDSSGQDVLYENTLPIEFDADAMPIAVVAADLAVSTDTRERSVGIRTLEQARRSWLAAH
jgi:hypothetical protein